jgi:hypothetical protein
MVSVEEQCILYLSNRVALLKITVENRDVPASTGSEGVIPASTGGEDLLSGTHGQTNHGEEWTEVKRSYARVLKGSVRAANRGARNIAAKLTHLSRGKSEQAHSIE